MTLGATRAQARMAPALRRNKCQALHVARCGVDHTWEARADRVKLEVVARLRRQEAGRRNRSRYLGEVVKHHRSKAPVWDRVNAQEYASEHPVAALDLHELAAKLRQARSPHRRHVLDPRQQCAVRQFLRQLLGLQEEIAVLEGLMAVGHAEVSCGKGSPLGHGKVQVELLFGPNRLQATQRGAEQTQLLVVGNGVAIKGDEQRLAGCQDAEELFEG